MRIRPLFLAIVLLACGPVRGNVGKAEHSRRAIHVWTTRAIATVLTEVGPEFERTTGFKLRVVSNLPAAFVRRAAACEPSDLLIADRQHSQALQVAGPLKTDSRTMSQGPSSSGTLMQPSD